ncbi:MAG: Hpt domain-containing protein, partial [Ectothiorhodospiraceae bacterium]
MNGQTDIDHSTLRWVKRELDETLHDAAEALGRFAEEPEDRTQLQFCVTHLHQVHGILQMLELGGAAMLTEEMEELGRALIDEKTSGGRDMAAEVLMRAILRLRDYLERVEAGQRDAAILILPLVNELRAARGQPLVTQSTLFGPDLQVELPARLEREADSLKEAARAARTKYQRGLLAFLRGRQAQRGIELMVAAVESLDAAAEDETAALPWWLAGGLLDALATGDLEEHTAAVRSLLGALERRMTALANDREVPPADDLLRGLLYYIGLAGRGTERLETISELFDLDRLLGEQQALEQAREGVFGPGASALRGVADLLREDLEGVKDTLDLMVRGSVQGPDQLSDAAAALQRVADTLGMLGQSGPRRVVQEQQQLLEQTSGQESPDEARLLRAAEALLYVEATLDGLVDAAGNDEQEGEEVDPEARLFESEYRGVYATVIDEAIAEVGHVKEGINRFLESHDPENLNGLAERFETIRGALDVMELGRASELVNAAQRYLGEGLRASGEVPDADVLDDLADTITGIEYYLEAVRDGRGPGEQALDVAENSLRRLGFAPPEASTASEATAELDNEGAEQQAEETAPAENPPVPESTSPEPGIDFSKKRGRVDLDVAVRSAEVDPDILEVFVEEADEVVETLREVFPRWRSNPEDHDALLTTRRMFHTLKGSGRLAGALLLGELAWSVENLLNRVLDRSLQPGESIYEIVDETIQQAPALVRELEGGPAPDSDVRGLMRRAAMLADPTWDEEDGAAGETPTATAPAEAETPSGNVQSDTESVDAAGEPETGAGAAGLQADEDLELPDTLEGTNGPDELAPDEGASEIELRGEDPAALDSDAEEWLTVDLGGEGDAGVDNDGGFDTAGEWPEIAEDFEEIEVSAPEEPSDADVGDGEETGQEPGPAMDPALYEIFSKETADHLANIREFLEGCRESYSGRCRVDERLIRSLHTLSGSARMAEVDPVARLGRKLEEFARSRYAEERLLDEEDRSLLERAAERTEEILEALGRSGAAVPGVDDLIDEVEARRGRDTAPSLEARAFSEPEPAADDTDGPAPRFAESDAEPETVSEHEPIDAIAEPLPEAAPSPEPEQGPEKAEGTTEPAAAEEMDPELAAIFLEEAEDILGFLDTTIQRWEDSPEAEGHTAELHRSLHTLKGGARLAGFNGIGHLCHALESLAADVAENRVPADDRFFELLHECLDRVGDMVAAASRGESVAAPEALIARVEELRGGRQAAPAEEEAAPDHELVDVFLEEATEILGGAESMVHDWRQVPDDDQFVTELQRSLHTLKGGARMAGFRPIADLSHALETLLREVDAGNVPVSHDLFDLMEQVNDRLIAMRDSAEEEQPLAAADDLFAKMEALREGGDAHPDSATADPAATPAAEPAAAEAEASERGAMPARPEPAETGPKPDTTPEPPEARRQGDVVRVRSDLLDNMVNYAGEVSIYRSRLEQQSGAVGFNLSELDQTVSRLREQLRTLEIETEAQILYRFERENDRPDRYDEDFDPLEMDRFSRIQELSRALSESVNDLMSIQGTLTNLNRENETLLLQQSRVNTDLQDGLMRTRMVPFANLVPRMRRIVRQASQELGKNAQLKVLGAEGEMDRTVLERVIPPLEHMLRNAVAHGIESPAERQAAGKPQSGTISVSLDREGADVVIRVSDDGSGMNLEAIRRKAVAQGLMAETAPLTDKEIMQFVLESGFSTAEKVTQIAGRGVGMDVVNAEIKQLGGNL